MDIRKEVFYRISGSDRPGELANITALLMDANVDMHGIWGFGVGGGKAEIIAVPKDPSQFKSVAMHTDWQVVEGNCFRLEGEDRAGALVDILRTISSEGINLHAVDAIALDGHFGCYLWGESDESEEQLAQLLGLRSPVA